MDDVVLDASAILAVLYQEPGIDTVFSMLPRSIINTVTLTEVVAKLTDGGLDESSIRRIISELGIRVVSFDEDQAYRAGLLRPLTRDAGLSLGDRACLALAQRDKLLAVTADRNWSRVCIGIDIRQIR